MALLWADPGLAQSIVGGCEAPSPALRKKHRVDVNEKLEYQLKFLGMNRGKAFFQTRKTKGGFWVKSKGKLKLDGFFHWLDAIDGRMVSFLNPKNSKPGRMFNHVYAGNSGEVRESAVFSADHHVSGTLIYKGRKRPATLQGTSEVVDALSALYYLRHRKFKAQKKFCFEVYHRRRLWRVEGQMSHKENISVKAGKGDAIVLKATVRRLGGGKSQGQRHQVKLWLSHDRHRLPLKFEAPIGFGDLRAELVGYTLSP